MLVLSRKSGEWIIIGDIRVQVVRVCGRTVQIGIEADSTVKVLRAELIDLRKKNNGHDTSE